MDNLAEIFITLGALFLLGLLTDLIGRRTPLPRVTLLLIFGFLCGPSGVDLLPGAPDRWFPMVADMALIMVGFLLGGKLTLTSLREHGRLVLWVSITAVVVTALVVGAGLVLVGVPLEMALLLAGIAPATAPAATVDVVHESRSDGRFTRTLLGVVALDDAWGLIVFSLLLAAVEVIGGQGGGAAVMRSAIGEIGGAVLVGLAVGVPTAFLTGRIQPGEPTLVEALGAVFLCGGIAIRLEVSFLLASMTLGFVVANLARHHSRPFHAIEGIEWPFMVLFFVLAGASLRLVSLGGLGALVASAYVVLRVAGRLAGGWLGVAASRGDMSGRWMGLALMPQAGVALGMALVASERLPDLGKAILPAVISATVLFEVVGPILTRQALVRVGEVGRQTGETGETGATDATE
jgi:Kef-type K+ transport system membrane component KefB